VPVVNAGPCGSIWGGDKANIGFSEILIATQDIKETLEIRSTEILHVANGVSETLLEFQTQVVQALRKLQHDSGVEEKS